MGARVAPTRGVASVGGLGRSQTCVPYLTKFLVGIGLVGRIGVLAYSMRMVLPGCVLLLCRQLDRSIIESGPNRDPRCMDPSVPPEPLVDWGVDRRLKFIEARVGI